MKPDGNVAFKVTWVYGKRGPFSSPCTPDGRRLNIHVAKKVWCRQPQCRCCQLDLAGNTAPALAIDEWPCNDSRAFRDWRFSSGWYHHGTKKNTPIPLRHALPGKLAFFTTRSYDMPERGRRVVACYEIREVTLESGECWVESIPATRVRVPDIKAAPRFWDYHRQAVGPSWGTGLFRYLPDSEAKRLRDAVLRAAGK